ncbi:MAG: ATP synthase F1 subunit gamma [Oligoflexia bacterium]|nr:ATP synthase F1 subunit gamma [Oligoflexia bacterium]
MPSIKDLKKRIGTVKNTQQTTKAMKMVSAAKLRRAQEAIHSHRPYARRIGALIRLVSSLSESSNGSLFFGKGAATGTGTEGETTVAKKRVLLVLVTSDRGLCGAFNGNVIKTAQRWMNENGANYETVQLAFVGRKAYDFYKNKKVNLGPYYAELGGKVDFTKAKKLADGVIELFVSGQVDEVKFIYNEFKNAVTQRVQVEDFLPLSPSSGQGGADAIAVPPMYLVKPSPEELLNQLMEKNFAIQAFRIMLESQAGEHGARMSAMENATKNAGEMIRKLTLQFNKQRQAGITKELLEIISGSESQKNSG